MIAHPEAIAGTHGCLDTDLMTAARDSGLPLIAKSGAEGTFGLGVITPFGPLGIALKIEDGGARGRNCTAIETLAQLGALPERVASAVESYHRPILRNRAGLPVGEVRSCFRLHWPTGPTRG
jgi:L-asparaginase II